RGDLADREGGGGDGRGGRAAGLRGPLEVDRPPRLTLTAAADPLRGRPPALAADVGGLGGLARLRGAHAPTLEADAATFGRELGGEDAGGTVRRDPADLDAAEG